MQDKCSYNYGSLLCLSAMKYELPCAYQRSSTIFVIYLFWFG
jgi:hypothetical protein